MKGATAKCPLINPRCKQDRRHMLIYYGIALCCVHDYSKDQHREPRSYTKPLEEAA